MKQCCKGITTKYCPECGNKITGKLTNEVKRVAIIMHASYCTWNHTDGCAWYYHEHDWTESTHVKYAKKAMKALLLHTVDEIALAYEINTKLKEIK